MTSIFNRIRAFVLGIFLFLAIALTGRVAFAEPFYSVSVHQSDAGYQLATLTAFKDADSCQTTAAERGVALEGEWKIVGSECFPSDRMMPDDLAMFEGRVVALPYITFLDANGFKNVVVFRNVPPGVLDVLIWKWADGLKQQNMQRVSVVMDSKRKKVKDVVDAAKEKIGGWTGKETEDASPTPAAPPQKSYTDRERLILKNGQTIDGIVLERRPDGIWFRADEGLEMLFTHAEIERVDSI